jgi:hypothetical protein
MKIEFELSDELLDDIYENAQAVLAKSVAMHAVMLDMGVSRNAVLSSLLQEFGNVTPEQDPNPMVTELTKATLYASAVFLLTLAFRREQARG